LSYKGEFSNCCSLIKFAFVSPFVSPDVSPDVLPDVSNEFQATSHFN
jgi:hypothetical protein